MKELTEVFIVHHVIELEDYEDEVIFIGVFTTIEKAQAAIDKIQNEPGFRDFKDGFSLEPHVLNRIGWLEGFVSVKDPKD